MFRKETPAPTQQETAKPTLPDFEKVFDLSKGILPAASGLRHSQERFEREKVHVDEQQNKLFSLMFTDVSEYYKLLQNAKEAAATYESGLAINTKTAKGQIKLPSYMTKDRLTVVLLGEITEEPQDVSVKIIRGRATGTVSQYQSPTRDTFEVELEHTNGLLAINLSMDKKGNYDIYTIQRSNKPEIEAVLRSPEPHKLDKKAEQLVIGARILHLLSMVKLEG